METVPTGHTFGCTGIMGIPWSVSRNSFHNSFKLVSIRFDSIRVKQVNASFFYYLIHLLWSLNRSCFSSHSYPPHVVPFRSVHPAHVKPRFVSPINSRKSKFEIRRWQLREVRSTIDNRRSTGCFGCLFDGPSSDTDLSKWAHFKGHSHSQTMWPSAETTPPKKLKKHRREQKSQRQNRLQKQKVVRQAIDCCTRLLDTLQLQQIVLWHAVPKSSTRFLDFLDNCKCHLSFEIYLLCVK